MANFEAGTAYVGLVPSAKGFSKEAKKALAAAGDLNKQVDLEADTKQLEQAIREVKAHLKALDREKASPSIDFDKSVAEARIAEVQAKLEELGRKEATPRVNVDIARARQELNGLERQLETINARRAEVNVDADISQAQTALGALEAKLAEVSRQKTEPKVTADTSTAQQRLTELDGRLAALAGKKVEPKVELAIAQAQQEALRIRAELDRLGTMRPNVQVNADIASAAAKLAAINAQLQNLNGKTANVNINSMSASQTTLILMGVVAALGAIGAAAPAAVAALAAVGGAVGGIGQGVGAALMGFSGIGDALKALEQDEKSAATSSSASSSKRAAGAKQVESAQRALQQAQVSADRAAITGAQQVQDAQRSLHQASVSAARAQIQAQEQVAAARRQVADAAVSAAQRVQSAEASLASAQRSRQYVQESLTRATQDAIRANRDLQMSVSGAALSEERASLSLAQARERLAKSTSTNPLERADLELSVREAEQQLKETQVRYGDLRSEQSQWAKSGVQGSQQVVAAQRALQDANRGVADAQRGLTDAQVSGARQVADAQASLAKAQRDAAWQQQDSARAVADAQRGVSRAVQQSAWQQQDAGRQVADAQRALAEAYVQGGETASASSKKAALALAELTPAGRSMVSFLKSEWQPTWKRTSDAVADVMLPKVERSLRNLLALEPLVRAGLVDAGSVIGDLAVKGSQLATSPAFRQDFATIMASNNRQLENYGDASISLFGAFTDLYSVAGPVSERFSRLVANSMEAFESFIIGKRATGELEEYLQQATDALMFIGGWLVDVSVDVYQLATALAPLGVGLLEVVRYITDLVAWAAQLSPGLTSISAAALIGAIALSKFGKAIAVGGAITNTVAGVRTAAGALTTVFNPATLAATGAMQRFGDHSTTAAKKIGLSEGAASKFGSAARGLGSLLPVAGAAVVGLALATDALTASASDAAAGLEKGGTAAAQMRQQIAEQNGAVGEGATGIDRFNQSVNEWIGSTTGLWATQQTANEELERSRAAMTNLERAQSLATEAQGNYEQALRDFGAASPEATAALQQLEARSKDVEIAQIAVREKTDLATAAMIWQRDEQLASLDANLRKRQADSQLADAQQRLADTIRDHGAGSREAASAQLDLEMAQSRAAAAAKESAGGQQAYNAAIGKMVADTKGPLSETLIGLVRTLDGAGLAAAGAKVQINDAGVAVATFPNGKTVTLDAQNAPTFFTNLQAAKAAVDSTKGTIGVDADPGVGVQKLGNFKLAVDQTTGVVKMDGDISPADADRLGIKAKTDGTTGTMWINGNPVNCDGSLNGMRVKVDQTTGVMTIDGDPTKANQKGQAAKDGISNPATQPVITPRVDPDPALDALKTWWGKVQEWFGRNPITPAGPAPNHTGVQNPNRGRYAAGGLVEGYAAGGAISHKQVIRGYPTGGRVRGPGTATSDSIPAMLSNGEYVIRASSVAKLGVPLLNQLNTFAAGGPVGLAGGGMPSAGSSVSSAAVAVPSGDPRATAASAAATSMLAQSMEAAASAAGVLRPSLAGVQAGQRALVAGGVAPLAGAITGPLNAALGLYQRQVGVQVPAANAALQGAQALTRASTAVTAANTAAASAQMAGAVTGMSVQAQAQHAGLRAGQAATQVSTNQTAANTAVNSAGMSSSVTGMSAVSQAQHSFLRQSQGQTVVANNTLAANTTMNTGRMSGDNAVMSATVQGHLQNVRGSQGTTVASTTAFADAWRAQLARTQPDSANPLRWVINFPIRSVTDAWNNLDAQFALGKKVNPYIPNFASGGLLRGPGTGTSDSILGLSAGGVPTARVSNGEFVVREAVTKRALPFLSALNRGDGEALQAAGALQKVTPKSFRGRSGFDQNLPPGFAAGGPVEQRIAAAKQWLSTEARGARYVYGGGTNPRAGMDCSSMVSAVTHILSGRPANSGRIGTTATMPWGGFAPGLRSAWSVGNKPSDHMAGTLAGQNVEQHGPNGTPFTFPSRWGADNGYFNQQWHLPVVGGQFVSGGAGGGGYDPTPAVNEAFAKAYREVADVTRFFGSSPQVVRDQGVARFSADKVKAHAMDKLTAMFAMSMGGVDISGISGAVVDQVKQVAARFGGWDKGPQWDNGIFPLVAKESSWNPNAANPTSSARGLFQKMTSIHGPVEPTPAGQANWGLGYIRDRYGDPMKAWAFHRARGYYDNGGMLGPGEIGLNATRYPERVLDNVETKSYDTLTRLVGKNGVQLTVADPGSSGPTIGTLNAVVPQGATVNDMARAVSFEMRRTKRGGVYARG